MFTIKKSMFTGRSKRLITILSIFILTSDNYIFANQMKNIAMNKNLIPNGGLEEVDEKGLPIKWIKYSFRDKDEGLKVVTDVVHSGQKALYFWATTKITMSKVGVRTDYLPVNENTIYTLSFWIKIKNVRKGKGARWNQALGEIWFYDADRRQISHQQTMCLSGTRNWINFSEKWTTPPNCKFVILKFLLCRCTGEIWLDDVSLKASSESNARIPLYIGRQHKKIIENFPIVIPTPRKERYSGKKIKLTRKSGLYCEKNFKKILQRNLQNFLINKGITVSLKEKSKLNGFQGTQIYLVNYLPLFIKKVIPNDFYEAYQKDQGYILFVGSLPGKNKVIVISATTDQGLLYGIQTLKQIIKKKKTGEVFVYEAQISDYPLIKIRGGVMGVQWFKKRNYEKYIKRAASLKFNRILGCGSWLNKTLGVRIREPLTNAEKKELKRFVKICQEYLITPSLAVCPTMPSDYIGKMKGKYTGTKGFDYLNENEFSLLFKKLDQIYNCGIRIFGLHFDDLRFCNQDKLHDPRHIKRFRNLANAHVYLVKRVYQYLKAKDRTIKIQMVPTTYTDPIRGGERFDKYLSSCANLPSEIEIICTGAMNKKSAEYFKKLTGRYPFIWSNYIAGYEKNPSAVIPPFHGGEKNIYKFIKGYVFLPMMPSKEDYKGISWLTAADFMWNPEKYSPDISFQKALYKKIPHSSIIVIQEYNKLKNKIFGSTPCNYFVPGKNKKEKIAYCEDVLDNLSSLMSKIRFLQPKPLKENFEKEILRYRKRWLMVLKETKERPFSIYLSQNKDTLIHDLRLIKTYKKPEVDTSFFLTYDSENFFVNAKCQEPNMDKVIALRNKRDTEVFKDDCIEIFISPNYKKVKEYYHFAINIKGAIFDESVKSGAIEFDQPGTNIMNKKWNAKGIKITTFRYSDSWEVKVKIPVKNFGINTITPGMRWRFNLCRTRYAANNEFSSYALLFEGYHSPERFATIEFK